MDNVTCCNATTLSRLETNSWWEAGRVQIPLYSLIFLLAVIGNSLVILTLVQHQRMRTITNVFLLNLSVSDLMLGVLCMPFTLMGTILRDFVFGDVMCRLVPYLQACSVSVSVWTLVAISVERYYAICHPLRSRRWQTLSHSYRLIAAIWSGSMFLMVPIAALSELIPTSNGHHKCREIWPGHGEYERAYNLILDAALLVLPLLVLAATYTLITRTLCRTDPMTTPVLPTHTKLPGTDSIVSEVYLGSRGDALTRCPPHSLERIPSVRRSQRSMLSTTTTLKPWEESVRQPLRRSNPKKTLSNKKRVIKMLFVVVLEFFICWTPLYVINTLVLFSPEAVYNGLGYTGISFFQLLAYSSSCCNPITYCFMNCGFRKSFLGLFRCCKDQRRYREPP